MQNASFFPIRINKSTHNFLIYDFDFSQLKSVNFVCFVSFLGFFHIENPTIRINKSMQNAIKMALAKIYPVKIYHIKVYQFSRSTTLRVTLVLIFNVPVCEKDMKISTNKVNSLNPSIK